MLPNGPADNRIALTRQGRILVHRGIAQFAQRRHLLRCLHVTAQARPVPVSEVNGVATQNSETPPLWPAVGPLPQFFFNSKEPPTMCDHGVTHSPREVRASIDIDSPSGHTLVLLDDGDNVA